MENCKDKLEHNQVLKGRRLLPLGAAGLAVALGVLLLFLPETSIAGLALWLGDFRDALHLPLFALIAVALAALGGLRPGSVHWRWGMVAGVLFILAVGSEVVQSYVGRSASRTDLVADVVGGLVGLVGWWCLLRRRWVVLGTAMVMMLVLFCFLARAAWLRPMALRAQEESQPQLLAAGSLSGWLLRAKGGTRVAWIGDEAGFQVNWQAGDWRGVEIRLAGGEAWSKATAMEIVIENPGGEFLLGVRMDGKGGSRATGELEVAPGHNRLVVARAGLSGDDAAWREPEWMSLHSGLDAEQRQFRVARIRLAQ